MAKTQHILFAPVYGLKLDSAVRGEIPLGRVTFISKAKIPRVRSRLGLKNTISYYRGRLGQMGHLLLDSADTYAYIRTNREQNNKDYTNE